MQDYEQYTRISRAPVIIPPAGAVPAQEPEKEEPDVEPEVPTEEKTAAPDLFRTTVFRPAARKHRAADRVLLVQSVLCGLVLAALLFLRTSSPAVFEAVRNWYVDQINREITVQVETPVSSAEESVSSTGGEG